ncbi:MAG: tRNA pseudouridine(38-40) synthase [Bacteroidota bacterium]|jgi:tRNA pseudouridine38-40 synthase
MSRYLLEFSYDGGSFSGYQIQPNAITVQSELENKLSILAQTKVEIIGSSRTDAGVHANQQFAHFDVHSIPEQDWVYRLNRMLPESLAVHGITQVKDDFHARFDAISRTYHYYIARKKLPLRSHDSYWFEVPLDIHSMNEACQILFQYIDFECFSKVKTDVFTFDCEIKFAKWDQKDDILQFTIQANRFLRGMVRAIVGTLLEVGLGKLTQSDLHEIIQSKDRNRAGRAVPAHGLHLMQVEYSKPNNGE